MSNPYTAAHRLPSFDDMLALAGTPEFTQLQLERLNRTIALRRKELATPWWKRPFIKFDYENL